MSTIEFLRMCGAHLISAVAVLPVLAVAFWAAAMAQKKPWMSMQSDLSGLLSTVAFAIALVALVLYGMSGGLLMQALHKGLEGCHPIARFLVEVLFVIVSLFLLGIAPRIVSSRKRASDVLHALHGRKTRKPFREVWPLLLTGLAIQGCLWFPLLLVGEMLNLSYWIDAWHWALSTPPVILNSLVIMVFTLFFVSVNFGFPLLALWYLLRRVEQKDT